jgi:hypothetical protein
MYGLNHKEFHQQQRQKVATLVQECGLVKSPTAKATNPTQAKRIEACDKKMIMIIIVATNTDTSTTIQPAFQLHQQNS